MCGADATVRSVQHRNQERSDFLCSTTASPVTNFGRLLEQMTTFLGLSFTRPVLLVRWDSGIWAVSFAHLTVPYTSPPKNQLPGIWKCLRKAGIQPWELYVVDNYKASPDALAAGPPPLDYYRSQVGARLSTIATTKSSKLRSIPNHQNM